MAERAISEGMHVAIADIGAKFLPAALEKLADAAAENKVRTHAGVCDVTKEESVRAFAAGVASEFVGGLRVMLWLLNTMRGFTVCSDASVCATVLAAWSAHLVPRVQRRSCRWGQWCHL